MSEKPQDGAAATAVMLVILKTRHPEPGLAKRPAWFSPLPLQECSGAKIPGPGTLLVWVQVSVYWAAWDANATPQDSEK